MTNYYYLALRNDGQLVLGRRTSGTHTPLATAPVQVSTGTWYTLRLEAAGSSLRVQLDGALLVSTTDGTSAPAGPGWSAGSRAPRSTT